MVSRFPPQHFSCDENLFEICSEMCTYIYTLYVYSHVFSRVTEYERKNKMGLSNLVRLFAPTLMTVDGDPVSPDTNIGHLVLCTYMYTPSLCRVNLVCCAWCFFAGLF